MRGTNSLIVTLTIAILLDLGLLSAAARAGAADQYVMFVSDVALSISSSNPIPAEFPYFGSIEAADYYANVFADQAELFDWDGSTIVFRAVMSKLGESARSRLNLQEGKPVLNMLGQQIVGSGPELFNATSTVLSAPILDEFGMAPPPNTPVWTGTFATGSHANSCSNWSATTGFGTVGRTDATNGRWIHDVNRACNQSARIYGLGILASPRAPGDYNDDGRVDAADYTVWRDTLSHTGLLLPADGNGNGIVDAADYEEWRKHYGESSLAASTVAKSERAVPEPFTLTMLLTFSCVLRVFLLVLQQAPISMVSTSRATAECTPGDSDLTAPGGW